MQPDLVQKVFAFVNKLKLFMMHIQKGDFLVLLKASRQHSNTTLNKQTARHATLVENLHENFLTWFRDL